MSGLFKVYVLCAIVHVMPFVQRKMFDHTEQRVLNDLGRTRLSRRRMNGFLPHPLLPRPSASCLSFSAFLCVADRASWRERGRGGAKSYDGEKAESSLDHLLCSLLCTVEHLALYKRRESLALFNHAILSGVRVINWILKADIVSNSKEPWSVFTINV